jgi:flagellar export protein FliJ
VGKMFSLSAVLRLREAEEERAEQTLQRAARQLREVDAALADSRNDKARQLESLSLAVQRGITGTELHWMQSCLDELDESIEQMQRSRERAESFFAQQQIEYQQAHQKRETFLTLQKQEAEASARDENRREQREQDELYLTRRHFERS